MAMPGLGLSTVFAGWKGLARFWSLVALLVAAGCITLQLLGPLPEPHREAVAAAPPPVAPQTPTETAPSQPKPPPGQAQQAASAPPVQRPGRSTPGPIADPDPALLEA